MGKQQISIQGNSRVLQLKNPVLTASGTFGYGLEFVPYGNLKTLGGMVMKGLSLKPRPGNKMPRIAETACGMLNAIGLHNCGVDAFIREKLPLLPYKDVPVIANLYGTSAEEFAALAAILEATEKIAALEINISCPNVKEGGVAFGQDPRQAAAVTKAVIKATKTIPIIVKLSPNVTSLPLIAKACTDAGATALSCINTITGMALDIETRKPLLGTVFGGLSGPAIKPIALRCVWEVSRAVNIPVIGIGGIQNARDVLEFIIAGAAAVQVGTANFSCPDASFRIAAELGRLMRHYNIPSLTQLCGTLDCS